MPQRHLQKLSLMRQIMKSNLYLRQIALVVINESFDVIIIVARLNLFYAPR